MIKLPINVYHVLNHLIIGMLLIISVLHVELASIITQLKRDVQAVQMGIAILKLQISVLQMRNQLSLHVEQIKYIMKILRNVYVQENL